MRGETRSQLKHILLLSILLLSAPGLADDYQEALNAVNSDGHVEVLVSHWRPISGDIDAKDLSSAITGDVAATNNTRQLMAYIIKQGGYAKNLRQFKYLNLTAISVDKQGLEATKSHRKEDAIWVNNTVDIDLADSTPALNAPVLWSQGHEGGGQIVVVIDTGVDTRHPFLAGRIAGEACFATICPNGREAMVGEGSAIPVKSHGTHVAGIIAGSNSSMQGVAPAADIFAINVFGPRDGYITSRDIDILAALDYVALLKIEHHLPIAAVNLSLGGGPFSKAPCDTTPYEEIAQILEAAGVAVISSSGNSNVKTGMQNPACSSSVISVGAIDKSGNVASFSNSVDFMDIWAPGVDIMSAIWREGQADGYESLSGTSMSTPQVAGAFAILRGIYPKLTVRKLLKNLQVGTVIHDRANNTSIPSLHLKPDSLPIPQATPTDTPSPTSNEGTSAITG